MFPFPSDEFTARADKWAEKWVPQLFFPFLFVVITGAILGVLFFGGK